MSRPLPLASAAILIAMVLLAMNRDFPLAGHDYRYFIPRLIDTRLFIAQNGWSIQWYTPSFGGGLPAFPNPQHLEFSLVQLFAVWLGSWAAVLATTTLVMAVGFASTYHLLRRRLALTDFESTLGAVFFAGSGFFIERMIVGHLGFQLYPLLPVMVLLVLGGRRPLAADAGLLALLFAAIVYHAGFQLAIVMAFATVMTLALVEAGGWLRVDIRRSFAASMIGVGVAILIAAPKLYAVGSFMRQFPREIRDVYNAGLLQAIAGFGAQFFSVMLLTPLFWVTGLKLSIIFGGLPKFMGIDPRMGLWELDSGLSPAAAFCLVLGAVRLVKHGPSWRTMAHRQRTALIILALLVWIAADLTLARGLWTMAFGLLPILRSLHSGVRYAPVFILPLSIAAAYAFAASSLVSHRIARALVWAVAVASPIAYVLLPSAAYSRNFDLTRSLAAEQRIANGERLPVSAIADVPDADALVEGKSSLQPYDPIFGYINETFATETTVGEVTDVRDGRFNMTNPAGLVFPAAAGSRPFERIAEGDRANLDALRQRRRPTWPLPAIVPWLNATAIAAVLASLLAASTALRKPR